MLRLDILFDALRAECRRASESVAIIRERGNCLEAAAGNGLVMVRDTTNREGGMLTFSASAWKAFVTRRSTSPART